MTRDGFRQAVFSRDHNMCVICGEQAVDAHHIMDRKLWSDGGYYLDNGASLCEKHHWDAELSKILPDELRKILKVECLLPPQLDPALSYDKWGKEISSQ